MNPRRPGFTLVELLVVLAVIGALMGLLFPMLTVVRRQAATTSTQSLLKRVDNALQRFQSEAGCTPYQDHSSGYPTANHLAWHLRHSMTSTEAAALKSDIRAASARYDPAAIGATMVITDNQVDPRETDSAPRLVHASIANRAARNRARLAILAGHTGITGLAFPGHSFNGTPLVPNPTSRGLAIDLLGADLESRELDGDAIIDRWKKPLIYVCPVVPGAKPTWLPGAVGTSDTSDKRPRLPFLPEYYGLQTRGRAPAASMSDSILTTAAEPFRFTYELWSSGPDRITSDIRNAKAARDDIAAAPYTKQIPP